MRDPSNFETTLQRVVNEIFERSDKPPLGDAPAYFVAASTRQIGGLTTADRFLSRPLRAPLRQGWLPSSIPPGSSNRGACMRRNRRPICAAAMRRRQKEVNFTASAIKCGGTRALAAPKPIATCFIQRPRSKPAGNDHSHRRLLFRKRVVSATSDPQRVGCVNNAS